MNKLLIVDEPTTGLDPLISSEFYKLIHKLNKLYGITIIMTSHDINSLTKYATKILHLKNNVQFLGTYEDYKKHAGYKFVDKNDRYLPRYCGLTTAEIEESVAEIKYTLKQKRMRWLVQFAYNSACNKQLLKTCSSQEERILFEVLYRCATKKPGKSATGVFCKMHDFDIQQIWDNLLIKDWGKLENQ